MVFLIGVSVIEVLPDGRPSEPVIETSVWYILVVFIFPGIVLLPVVMAASGVGLRRWVPPATRALLRRLAATLQP